MSVKLSRTKIARYVAAELPDHKSDVIRQLAGYLIDTRRTGELDLITRAIYEQLEQRGIVVADVTTAETLTDQARLAIEELTSATQLELREHTDGSILGGIRLETPSQILDATLARRLTLLRESKI